MPRNILEKAIPEAFRDPKAAAARESFWEFCKLMNADFYRDDRPHLRELADTLQALWEGKLKAPDGKKCRKLAISEPPRHGKSYTMSLFNEWVLGKRKKTKIINVSYNSILSTRFARTVRDGISATKADPTITIFSDVFPGVRIKEGDAAMDMWSLEGSYFTFLAASFGATVTGIGCDLMIIDDPIKENREAYNERLLAEKWDYFRNTLRSRIEKGGILIVVMTRWARKDLIGRFLELEPEQWCVLNQPACIDEKTEAMLCPDILGFDDWTNIRDTMAPDIFLANYQNKPVDIMGRLYSEFATYDEMPTDAKGAAIPGKVIAYIDTADTGADYLCAVIANKVEGRGYVTDIVYTDEPMEKTEPLVARALYRAGCVECVVESNKGGRGFARNVGRILWDTFSSRRTRIIDRNQRANKESRILTEAPFVMQNILYPEGWETRWPAYYRAMSEYQRKGQNLHDDAPDATTGLAEYIQRGAGVRKKLFSGKGARR